MTSNASLPPTPKSKFLTLFFGGLLPVIAFTVIEQKYGVIQGLIAGMIFGLGEMTYELIRFKKVSTMTWIGNGLLLALGVVSLISTDGIWFKLQPALIEFGFFIFLLGSWLLRKPFLIMVVEKQNPKTPQFLKDNLGGMTLRLSIFFLLHALTAFWAAFFWSSEAWALLKGVGLTVSMVLYMIIEVLWMRYKVRRRQ